MNKANKSGVPALRFFEFKNAPVWEEKKLEDICDVNPTINKLPHSFIYVDLESVVTGKLLQENEIQKESAPSRAQRLLSKGDVIYQTVRPYQKNNLFFNLNNGKDYVASTGYAQLRAFESNSFLYQLIHIDTFVNKVLEQSTGSNYPAINSKDLAKINIFIPKPKEQQKIADFLTSLDDLITAQSQKVDSLKQHKKGLMQQLFPQADTNLPKLRFPDFKNSPVWQEKKLECVINFYNGKAHEKNIVEHGKYIVVNSKFISTNGTVKKYTNNPKLLANTGDIVMVMSDVPNGKAIAKCFRINQENYYTINQRICLLKPIKNNSNFLFFILNRNKYYLNFDDGVKQTNLKNNDVLNCPLNIPELPEQQKIADCLTSLDDLITAQSQKIETLQQHKKGLMQQLFPNNETSL